MGVKFADMIIFTDEPKKYGDIVQIHGQVVDDEPVEFADKPIRGMVTKCEPRQDMYRVWQCEVIEEMECGCLPSCGCYSL